MIKKGSLGRLVLGWMVHAFTASAAFIGLLALVAIHQADYHLALCYMAITVVIDAIDGTFARFVGVKSYIPLFDGTLLDNIVDYLNYVIVPCFFLLVKPGMLPPHFEWLVTVAIILSSSYQFCQADAKTADHFFKGFPCYWNITVFYLFIFGTSQWFNAVLLTIFCVLVFVPIKYVYPSRLDYLTRSKRLKLMMHAFSGLYGIATGFVLWYYPLIPTGWLLLALSYTFLYLGLSFYRTCWPMIRAKRDAHKKDEAGVYKI